MIVKAKRAGYTERLTPEQEFDMAPWNEDRAGEDLEGELVRRTSDTPFGPVETVLVSGQEADPSTIEEVNDAG